MTDFTATDLAKIEAMGYNRERIEKQIEIFQKGVAPMKLDRACVIGDGITVIAEADHERLLARFEAARAQGRVTKFVPASGAASRMFKALHAARERLNKGESIKDAAVQDLLDNLHRFALGKKTLEEAGDLDNLGDNARQLRLLDIMLGDSGLNFGAKPKGLLPFHDYPEGARTPVEEHLMEAAAYAADADGKARLHFTVSPEHQKGFEQLVAWADPHFKDTSFEVGFSVQARDTDTIAVTPENQPFRDGDDILFRPGGHGALIRNLDELDADIVFIKNIDNVVPDRLKDTTILYKKLLGGLLLETRDTIFGYIRQLKAGEQGVKELAQINVFIREQLGLQTADDIAEDPERLLQILNRPIRVCGMVRNEGEPGGGPFWTQAANGDRSMQIVESSQIDTKQSDQAEIVQSATHFNPVDLVCALTDVDGNRFPLKPFIDDNAWFIAEKSKDGRPLRALERPGLWNGAMSHWNTLFVEVPLITFNPVKSANDLLREQHL